MRGRTRKGDKLFIAASASVRSHTWFVLTYLLGLNNVRNYDGSWTEWGNRVGRPIEKAGRYLPSGSISTRSGYFAKLAYDRSNNPYHCGAVEAAW